MAEGCGCNSNGETLIYTCAGAAYSGQVANNAGVNLAKAGPGKLFCAAAVAAEIPAKLKRALGVSRSIVIDGCEDHCAKRIMEKAGVTVDLHVVVTDLGVSKAPKEPQMDADVKCVVDRVKKNGCQG